MHGDEREQLVAGLHTDAASRGNELYRRRRQERRRLQRRSVPDASAAAAAGCTPSSPRGGDAQLLCKYKSGKCGNPRATKRNGQLHTLCHFHRDRQNEHQRKSDRKHRMVSVAQRAKLGSLGLGAASARRHSLHSITSLEAAFPTASAISPFHYDQSAADAFRSAHLAAAAGPGLPPPPPPPAPAPRLPPISTLMPPGKLDGYRTSSATAPTLPPSSFLTDNLNGHAGKMA